MTSAGTRRTEKLRAILAATEELMLEQGYGSVTYRSVAANAARSEHPLRALWEYANNRSGTALLMEFMALANHRPGVGDVIGEGGERVRCAVVGAVSGRWPDYGLDEAELAPAALVFLLGAIPRMVHLEEALGTFTGHAETVDLVERFLNRIEPAVGD
jgi:hypothetical protein